MITIPTFGTWEYITGLLNLNFGAVDKLIFAQKTHASLVHTTADGTGIPNPSGVLTYATPGNGADSL